MDHVEVLASGLSDNAGVRLVVLDVVTNVLPELAEDVGRTGEVEGSELGVLQDLGDNLGGGAGDELDDTSGETSLAHDLVNDVRGVGGSGGGLPDADVTHQDGGTSEVTTDGGEIEGRDGKDESLQGTVLGTVPGAGAVLGGLDSVELLGELDTEAPEVDHLGGRVDLGLPGVLTLTEHGGSHDLVSIGFIEGESLTELVWEVECVFVGVMSACRC